MKLKDIEVGKVYAIGAPGSVYTRVKSGHVKEIGVKKQRHTWDQPPGGWYKPGPGVLVQVESWQPSKLTLEVVPPGHVLMLWDEWEVKQKKEEKENKIAVAATAKLVAEREARAANLSARLKALGFFDVVHGGRVCPAIRWETLETLIRMAESTLVPLE